MPKLLRERESGSGLNSFIMPGLAKAKALYYLIWLVLREEGDPGGWSSIIIMPNYSR
jgi:hypothetical protein